MANLSSKGEDVLARIVDLHRKYMNGDTHPGINENDIERNFLERVLQGFTFGNEIGPDSELRSIWKSIQEIR